MYRPCHNHSESQDPGMTFSGPPSQLVYVDILVLFPLLYELPRTQLNFFW